MDARGFDQLTRAIATGTSRRRALKIFLGSAVGLGLFGQAIAQAQEAPTSVDSRADIARTSVNLLSRMPTQAAVQKLPANVRAASDDLRRLLTLGTQAQGWSDAQLQSFRTQVDANVLQHKQLASSMSQPQAGGLPCFMNCATRFQQDIANCNGGLLCQLVVVVEFDLCVVLCIL
jgi:hypothetical protein